MLCTVTNLTLNILNDFDTITSPVGFSGPSSLLAVGGSRKRPLPYPFSHVVLAASGAKELAMNQMDWNHRSVYGMANPSVEWNQLIQAGTVSMGFAAQTDIQSGQDLSDAIDTI